LTTNKSRLEQNLDGDAANGRIHVVSASGQELMPCKPAKALSLLGSGKAVGKWTEGGPFYLQLKYDPKSPIFHLETSLIKDGDARDEDAKVWELVGSASDSLTKRINSTVKNRLVRRKLGLEEGDGALLDALMETFKYGELKRVVSSLMRRTLAPIVRKLLKALGSSKKLQGPQLGYEGTMDKEEVRGALYLACKPIYRVMRGVAEEVSRIAQRWGNTLARLWPEDPGFIKYLTMMNLPQNKNPPSIITIRF